MGRKVWSAMLVAAFCWGTGGVATRAAFDEGIDPLALATSRAVFALLLVLVYLKVRRRRLPRERATWRLGTVMGITNLAGPFILFTLAYQYVSAGFIGLNAALIPIGTAVWAHLIVPNESMNLRKLAGMAVALVGVAVLALSGDSGLETGGRPGLALLLSASAVAFISFAGAYAKRPAGDYDPIEVSGVQFLVGATLLVIVTPIVEGIPGNPTATGWAVIGYLSAAGTFLPFALFYWILRRVSATQASLIGYLVPLIAVFAGVLIRDELLSPGIVFGGLLILIGVIVTDRLELHRRTGWDATGAG